MTFRNLSAPAQSAPVVSAAVLISFSVLITDGVHATSVGYTLPLAWYLLSDMMGDEGSSSSALKRVGFEGGRSDDSL